MNVNQHPVGGLKGYRQTVSGLFYCFGMGQVPLIGVHWPKKAELAEEANLSPVAGVWKKGETAEAAMERRVKAEYGTLLEIKIRKLIHPAFFSNATLKQYHWLLVELNQSPTTVVPEAKEVSSFGWYSPHQLEQGIALMHREKQNFFRQVLRIAIAVESNLLPFRRHFG